MPIFLDTEAFMNGYVDADAAQAAGLRYKISRFG